MNFKLERKHKLINAYEIPDIKKKSVKKKDEQFQHTGIAINSRILCVGGSGTGKTNAIFNYIVGSSQPKKGTFAEIILVYKTDEKIYNFLKEKAGNRLVTYKNIADLPNAEDFPDQETKPINEQEERLLIFDDMICDIDKYTQSKIEKFFTFGRKKGLTTFFLSQSFYKTNKLLRQQMNYLLLLKVPSKKDLKAILKDYAMEIDIDSLLKIYNEATKEQLDFLKIDLNASVSINKRFSLNLLDYFEFDSVPAKIV